ncbi:MAG TPA: hypothetical protein VMH81_40090 [Bryobacteraceae bacterium]|nr:hypothetical protein [Bryobacteraceae bacterium]
MWRALIFVALSAIPAVAQTIADPSRFTAAMADFEGSFNAQPLRCEVTPIRPMLNFGFRFQAGYMASVPMSQYLGKGHSLVILVRVTPEGGTGKPVYLGSRIRLPEIPRTKTEMEIGGFYLLGEGHYQVAWKMWDESGRVCRKHWKMDARLTHGEHTVKVALPPETVADLGLNGAPAASPGPDDAPPIRLTVLLHAAPTSPRRMRLSGRDRQMLLGTLSALLDRLPARSVRLVVFNLDQQKELYRDDQFMTQFLYRVVQSLDTVELGTVDMQVLRNPGGHLDLLTDLIHSELTSQSPSDVVVFLGPIARFSDKVPSELLERSGGQAPHFYYIQYRSLMPQPSEFPDVITRAVARLKGKTLVVHTPGDFAKAIEQVERKQ